jgi:hypothetical protein
MLQVKNRFCNLTRRAMEAATTSQCSTVHILHFLFWLRHEAAPQRAGYTSILQTSLDKWSARSPLSPFANTWQQDVKVDLRHYLGHLSGGAEDNHRNLSGQAGMVWNLLAARLTLVSLLAFSSTLKMQAIVHLYVGWLSTGYMVLHRRWQNASYTQLLQPRNQHKS